MMKWIHADLDYKLSDVVVLLDNSKIYHSKKTMKLLQDWGAKIMFIPPYSPSLAPVELIFNTMKRRLTKQCKDRLIKMNKAEGVRELKETLSTFTRAEIVRCWRSMLNDIKYTI